MKLTNSSEKLYAENRKDEVFVVISDGRIVTLCCAEAGE